VTPLDGLVSAIALAGAEGRTYLTEPESYSIASHLGLGVPHHCVVQGPGDVEATLLDGFPGDRVVVKAIAPGLVHKAAAGAVRFVERDRDAVAAVVDEVVTAVGAAGCLIAEIVPHHGPEVILGLRRVPAFGLVLTVAAGGVFADALAGALGAAMFAVPCDEQTVHRVLSGLAVVGDVESLAGAISTAAERAGDLPAEIVEVDLNPIVATPRGFVALDAFSRLGSGAAPSPEREERLVEAVFLPSTIGVIGVSSGDNPGRAILRNIVNAGFSADRVVVIKPGMEEIEGIRCVPNLDDLDAPVDLLVVAVGAAAAAGVVEVVAAGHLARAVVLIPGGMGERAGSEPLAARVEAVIDRSAGPLIIGGNCMGIRSVPGRYDTTFIPPERLAAPADAPVAPLAVISQSGAFAITRLDRFPSMRPRYLVTLGNQIDMTVGDALRYVAEDPGVSVAACYVEGFRPGDGTRFLAAARRLIGRGGAVVLMMGGTTGPGRVSAASHTAAIAADPRVATSLAEQTGVLVAGSLDGFEDLVRLAVGWHARDPGGMRLGAVTNAGFEAVAIADALGPMTLAQFSPATVGVIDGVLLRVGIDEVVAVRNPLDLTPIADDAAYGEVVEAVLDDPGVDVAVIGCVPLTPALRARDDEVGMEGSIGNILASFAEHPTPWIAVVDGGDRYDTLRAMLDAAGVPVFGTADRAVRALGRLSSARAGG
jgi:acyl-CoA synthetase (NDP forming)